MVDIDDIAQSLAGDLSRRNALKSLLSGALGALGLAGMAVTGIGAKPAKQGKKPAKSSKGKRFAICQCQSNRQGTTCRTRYFGSATAVKRHLARNEDDTKGKCSRRECAGYTESCATIPCCGDDLVCSHTICVEKNPTQCGTICWVGYDRTSGCAESCLCVADEPGGYQGTCQPIEPLCSADECTSDEQCNQQAEGCECRFADPYDEKGVCLTEDPVQVCKAKECHSDAECNPYVEGCTCVFEDPYDPYAPGVCSTENYD